MVLRSTSALSILSVLSAVVGAAYVTGCSGGSPEASGPDWAVAHDAAGADAGAGGDAAQANGGSGSGGGGGSESIPLNDDDGGGPNAPERHVVFVTSATFNGNFTQGGSSGLAGADQACADAATNGGLQGTFKAWLSSSEGNAIDRLEDVGPWQLVDGRAVFDDKRAIADGPQVAIELDEQGNTVHETVWTGTNVDGTHAGVSCNNWSWSSLPYAGEFGHSDATDKTWTYGADVTNLPIIGGVISGGDCGSQFHLYCFQQ